jgi:hypothetical protein
MADLMGKSDVELAEEQGEGEGLVKGGMGWHAGFVVVFRVCMIFIGCEDRKGEGRGEEGRQWGEKKQVVN